MLTKTGLASLAVAAGFLVCQPAVAEITEAEKAQARQHFKQGKVALEIGRFAEALKEFQAGYKLAELPAFLFNIGQCYRNLENFEKAIYSYRLYLDKLPNAPNRAAVETLIAELEEKAREKAQQQQTEVPTKVPSYQPEPKRPEVPVPPLRRQRPAPWYTQWWFWVPVGVVVSGAAVAGGYYAFRKGEPDMPPSELGVWDLSR